MHFYVSKFRTLLVTGASLPAAERWEGLCRLVQLGCYLRRRPIHMQRIVVAFTLVSSKVGDEHPVAAVIPLEMAS